MTNIFFKSFKYQYPKKYKLMAKEILKNEEKIIHKIGVYVLFNFENNFIVINEKSLNIKNLEVNSEEKAVNIDLDYYKSSGQEQTKLF